MNIRNPVGRLQALRRYDILDTPPEDAFDRLTELVADVLEVPIALLVLVDEEREWVKSSTGGDYQGRSFDTSFCAAAIDSSGVLVVEDATKDERFVNSPFVAGDIGIRFYAGAPLVMQDGCRIGALCALGREPGSFSDTDQKRLMTLAAMAVDELEFRRESMARQQAERQNRLQNRILEKVNEGLSLQHILSDLLKSLEQERPEMITSVLLYDEEHGCLRHGAAPSLPDKYNQAVDGLPVGPMAGSCGTAVYSGESVIVEDIATDPRWKDDKDLALGYGLKACWSTPIKCSQGKSIASIAVYYKEPGAPPESDRNLVEEARSLARLAIVRHRDAEAFRAKERRFNAVFNDPNILVGLLTPEGRVIDINETAMGYIESSLNEIRGVFFWDTPWFSQASAPSVKKWTLQAAQGEYVEFEVDVSTRDELRTIKGVFRPVFDDDGKVVSVLVSDRDITEQKRARERLNEQKVWFQSIAENVADGIFRTSRATGEIVYGNQAFLDMFGYESIEDISSTDPEGLYTDPAERELVFDAVLEKDGFDRREVTYQRKDGSTFTALVSATIIYGEDGEPLYHDGAITDITEQKQTEEALRQSEAKLRAVANSIPGVLYQLHVQGEGSYSFTHVSDQAESLLGLSQDVTFEEVVARIPEPHQAEFVAMVEEAAEEQAPAHIEFPFQKEVGEVLWLHAAYHPEETTDGLVFNGVLLDITEQKDAERRGRVLASALEQGGESILITEAEPLDPPGPRILYVNPAFEEMTGYGSEEVVGKTPRLLQGAKTDRAVLDRLRTCLERGRIFAGEAINYRKDGTSYIVNWTVAPVRGEGGEIEYWVAVQRDVTEERKRERALRKAKEEAEEAARLKSALLSNVSHEIRTPLTSILGFAEVIREMDLGAEPEEFSRLISESGKRLLSTLSAVLDLSKLQAGTMDLNPERMQIDERVREIVEGLRPEAEIAGVDLTMDDSSELRQAVLDEVALQRVLSTLIGNSIKFTPEGGSIIVNVSETDEQVIFEVKDTGVGIAPEFMPDLFEAFKQESTGATRNYDGVGLSLAITKHIVEQLGGEIDVESEKGVGTRFRVRLPRVVVRKEIS